jgi:uncharacterized repeat protein (TIGR02543 family)
MSRPFSFREVAVLPVLGLLLCVGCSNPTSPNPNSTTTTTGTYKVTFDANGGSGTMVQQSIVSGTAANLTVNAFFKTGSTFAGWATTCTGSMAYANGASYAMGSSNVTLYAIWTTAYLSGTHTVTFKVLGSNTFVSNSLYLILQNSSGILTSSSPATVYDVIPKQNLPYSKSYAMVFSGTGSTLEGSASETCSGAGNLTFSVLVDGLQVATSSAAGTHSTQMIQANLPDSIY